MRYLRRIGFAGTPTYHALTGQLAKSDDATRQTLAAGYARWIELLEQSFQHMKDRGVLGTKGGAQAVGTGRRGQPPRRRHHLVRLPPGMAVGRHAAVRGELPAHVRRRPSRADVAPTAPATRPASTRNRPRMTARQRFTRKGLATRTRIVEGAAELMFDHGVSGISLNDVRSTVGVSGSQLSHYFADKRDLTRQVIASRTNDVAGLSYATRTGWTRQLQGAPRLGRCDRGTDAGGLSTGRMHLRIAHG